MAGIPHPVAFDPDGHRTDARRDESGKAYCGAKTKKGPPCKRSPMLGRTRCSRHGGRSLVGRDSPTFKTGSHSRYRAVLRLGDLADNDLELMDMRRPIQLTEEILSRLAERMKENDSPAFRAECKLRLGKLRAVMLDPTSTPQQISGALNSLSGWIDRGKREDSALLAIQVSCDRLSTQQKRAWDVRTSATQVVNKTDMHEMALSMVRIAREEGGEEVGARILKRVWAEVLGGGNS